MTVIYCDTCRAPLPLKSKASKFPAGWETAYGIREALDLCPPCREKLVQIIETVAWYRPPVADSDDQQRSPEVPDITRDLTLVVDRTG